MSDRSSVISVQDLSPSERRLVTAMQELGYGRFEFLQIERGEVVLDPWPSSVRKVKFGAGDLAGLKERPAEFALKKQVVEFFEHVRAVDAGEIRTLEVQNGLPFSMEIKLRHGHAGGH